MEAISFQVHDDYDGVWCYVSMSGLGLERIPAEGSFGGGMSGAGTSRPKWGRRIAA